jgi:hypothetical protein
MKPSLTVSEKGERKPRRLCRLPRAADWLDLKVPTLRAWFLSRKNLDFVKCGRAVCVTEESIERFIEANTIPAVRK